MNLGNELVSHIIRTQEIRPFLDADLNLDWLSSDTDNSADVLLGEQDKRAYSFLLRHFAEFRKVPTKDLFRRSFPAASYRLSGEEYTAPELLGVAEEEIQRYVVEEASATINTLYANEDYQGAADFMEEAARRIRSARAKKALVTYWDAQDVDIDGKITREVEGGIRTGISELDKLFPGFPKGSLITYLGCAKAGKTSFLLLSALDSWRAGLKVLVLTVEMSSEEIDDKLDGMEAHIDISLYQDGKLSDKDADKLRTLNSSRKEYDPAFVIVETSGKYTISDLEDAIEKHEPDVVYIDGFYFLIDRHTGKPGANWEGHDNLARELKEVAMREGITVVTTMQVREKQLKRSAIDDSAMMGGTALIMASHMVFGFIADPDTGIHTISNTRSRTGYLPTFHGTWDWKTATFEIDYEYGKEHDDSDVTY